MYTNLNALISIRHHSNEEIYQNNHRDQQVDAKDDFEKDFGPFGAQMAHGIYVKRRCLSKDCEKQTLEGQEWGHRSCGSHPIWIVVEF